MDHDSAGSFLQETPVGIALTSPCYNDITPVYALWWVWITGNLAYQGLFRSVEGKKLQMNANEVLIDLLEDNRRRLWRVFGSMKDEVVFWRPEAEANSIAITVWHMARILDVFLTRQVRGDSPEQECWFQQGWAAQTGYDPRGIGQNGWGMLTGYTQAEVAAMPPLTREQALGYLDQVYDQVKGYLAGTPAEKLLTPAVGFDGKYTQYQCLQMALMDNVRHLGEIFAIKASWERHNQQVSG